MKPFRRGKTRTQKHRMRKKLNKDIPADQRAHAARVLRTSKYIRGMAAREEAVNKIMAGQAEDQEPVTPAKPEPVRSSDDGEE